MIYKKILSIIIIICMVVSIVGCGALDVMKDLKTKETPEVSDVSDLSDFAIIDDSVDQEEVAIDTITVDVSNVETKDIIAYYEDVNGFLVPVNTKIPKEEGIAKATVRSMVKGNAIEKKIAQAGLHGVLPENTEIIGMSIKDGLCRVDFTENILNTETYEQEKNMISALTYTLTEFPTIDRVELLVEGRIMPSLSKGYKADVAFERKNINLYGSENGVNYTVYYKTPDTEIAGYYVPITFSADKVGNPVITVVEQLFNGPPSGLSVSNKIPYGVNFQGLNVVADTAIVNLGIGAVNLSQDEFEEMSKIVVLCLEQFNEIKEVDYTIEGMSFQEAGLVFEDDNVTAVFNQY